MRGTHGTSKANSKSIIKQCNFIAGKGLRGEGVYFWDYSLPTSRPRCLDLAECHWRQGFNNTRQIRENRCVIIDVGFKEDSEIYDTLDKFNYEGLQKFVESSFNKLNSSYTHKEVEEAMPYVYDSFIERLERAEKTEIHLFRFTVEVSRVYFPRHKFPVNPTCVVMRNANCIHSVAIVDRKNAPFKVA